MIYVVVAKLVGTGKALQAGGAGIRSIKKGNHLGVEMAILGYNTASHSPGHWTLHSQESSGTTCTLYPFQISPVTQTLVYKIMVNLSVPSRITYQGTCLTEGIGRAVSA